MSGVTFSILRDTAEIQFQNPGHPCFRAQTLESRSTGDTLRQGDPETLPYG